jgi:Dihaem cytochrome c
MRSTLLVVVLGLTGCVSLPQPTPADVARAQSAYPDTTLVSLTEDRRTYVKICSGCHSLHLPKEFPAQKWPSLVDEMVQVQKVKLSVEQRRQIEEFLIVMASAPNEKP